MFRTTRALSRVTAGPATAARFGATWTPTTRGARTSSGRSIGAASSGPTEPAPLLLRPPDSVKDVISALQEVEILEEVEEVEEMSLEDP